MHRSDLISAVILSFYILQFCNALQNGSINGKCNYYVIVKEIEQFQCFEKMKGHEQKCGFSQSTPTCNTHKKDGIWCIKWPSNIDLMCMNDAGIIDGKTCASDQKSIRCEGEYKDDELRNSVSTLWMSVPWIAALIPAVIFALT